MAFPSSTGTRPDNLDNAWNLARQIAGSIKALSTNMATTLAAGPTSALAIMSLESALVSYKSDLTKISALSGISAYAQAQIGDATINVAVEFSSMMTQINNVISWVTTNFPKDVSGYLLVSQFDGNGVVQSRTFPSSQTVGLVTALNSLVASID